MLAGLGEYIQANPDLVISVLRQDPSLAASAVRSVLELNASKDAPNRDTSAYPILGPWGQGSTQPLQQTLPKATPANIRRFSEIPPARRAIRAIVDPIIDLPWAIQLRLPIGKNAHMKQPEPDDRQHQEIVAITQMLTMPNNDCTWRQWLSMVLEDLLVFGAGPFEVQENTSDERPAFLWPVDAQSIRINAGWSEGSETYRYSQGRGYFYGTLGSPDMVKLGNDELCYMKLNPRDSTPFGLGYAEVAFQTVNAFIGGFEYAERRASNNTPNFGIFLGENVTPEQCRAWQHYWINEIEGYGKTPILGGGKQPSVFQMTGTGEDQLYIRWMEFCIRVIGMSFGVTPFRLGLERDINRSTAKESQDNDWMTVAPVANIIRDYLTHWLLWYRLGYKDYEFAWQVKTADELKQAEILALQYNSNAITVDEIRQIYERNPLENGQGDMTKTAYEAAIKAALTPPSVAGVPGQGQRPQAGGQEAMVTPFDQEKDELSPQEMEFIRQLITLKRDERYGLRAVAT